MKSAQSVFHGVVAGVVVVLMLLTGPAVSATSGQQEFRFRVLLDDDEIGTHHFRVRREAGEEIVEIDAEFKVKFIGITVYSYVHANRELWRDGCLQRIESSTDDNGDAFKVDGRDEGERFQLSTQDGERELAAGCVMSFAYWNPAFLKQDRLINTQDGEYLDVEVSPPVLEQREVRGEMQPSWRYSLEAGPLKLDLWYSTNDEWLALESEAQGGRTLRYELL